jgi:hypothetical protein
MTDPRNTDRQLTHLRHQLYKWHGYWRQLRIKHTCNATETRPRNIAMMYVIKT